MELFTAIKNRRSHYDLTNVSPIQDSDLQKILKDAIAYTPSAFHSQSSRVLLLLGDQHQKLWDIVIKTLRARIPADKFAPTEAKINTFIAGYGTILFFEDMNVITKLQREFPSYADNFPVWSNQSAGMLQYAIWTSLSSVGLGASLQHYNPIIDEEVQKVFQVQEEWKLLAQMPFGVSKGLPSELSYMPIEERFFVKAGKRK